MAIWRHLGGLCRPRHRPIHPFDGALGRAGQFGHWTYLGGLGKTIYRLALRADAARASTGEESPLLAAILCRLRSRKLLAEGFAQFSEDLEFTRHETAKSQDA